MARSLRSPRRPAPTVRRRLRLESLEDRLTPALHVWTGGPNGDGTQWLDPGNWLVAGSIPPVHAVPGPNDDAGIPAGGAVTIVLDASTSVRSVNSQRNVRITNGTLSVSGVPSQVGDTVTSMMLDGGSFNPADGATINGTLGGPSPWVIPAGRTINIQQLGINAPFVNNGTVIARAVNAINGGGTNAAGAILRLQGDAVLGVSELQISAAGFTNNGTTRMNSNGVGAHLNMGGIFTNSVGATFDVAAGAGGERKITLSNASFLNRGATTLSNDLLVRLPGVSHFTTSGTITVNPGATLLMDGNGGASHFDYEGGPLNGGGALNIQALSVNIATGATLTNGALTLATTVGNFGVAINGPGTLANPTGQTLNLANTTVNAPFTNAGTVNLRGNSAINGGLTASSTSTTRVLGDSAVGNALLVVGAGGVSNSGAFELTSTGATGSFASVQTGNGGTFTNAVGSTFRVLTGSGGGRSIDGGPFVTNGTMTVGTDLAVNFSQFTTTGALTIQPGATLTTTGLILNYLGGSISGGGTLSSSVNIGAGLTLTNGPIAIVMVGRITEGPGTLANAAGATFEPRNSTISTPFTNAGTLNIRGEVSFRGGLTSASGAVIRVIGDSASGNATLRFDSAVPSTNNGLLEMTSATSANNATLIVGGGGSFTNAVGATVNVLAGTSGSRTVSGSQFVNAGAFNLVDTDMAIDAFSNFVNSGTINIGAGRTLTVGIITTLNNTGTLAGAGALTLNGILTGNGLVSPGFSPGRLTINGNAVFGGFVAELNGLTSGTQYDQLVVNGTVTLSGTLSPSLAFGPAYGGGFTIIDNDGTDPIVGTFAGGPLYTINGVLFAISYTGGTGNDVVLTPVPKIFDSKVNDGAIQRSKVNSLTFSFNSLVNFAGPVASAFTLTRIGGGSVAFAATASVVGGGTVVTLSSFTGSETQNGSLRDGRYTLTALANQISNAAGQLDSGTNFTFGDAQGLFRLFGDINGDRRVNIADYGVFSVSYMNAANYNAAFDFNNDGVINIADYGQFSVRYLAPLP